MGFAPLFGWSPALLITVHALWDSPLFLDGPLSIAVVSAAVNVICELARRNPKSYLPLAPQLYGLLTNSTNNWMLIKIIKLRACCVQTVWLDYHYYYYYKAWGREGHHDTGASFAALAPLEPRLIKKLVPQISSVIQSTSAMSLLYECIHTVIIGGMIGPETENGENEAQDSALARLCTAKLKLFIEEPDQNLKYLGLCALSKLLAVRPKAVVEHRDTILECLDDADVSIRMRALDIVTGMVTPGNLVQIVRKLMTQLLPPTLDTSPSATYPPPSFTPILDATDRAHVIERIISICSQDTYANVTNFEWYITLLTNLVRVRGVDVGTRLSAQLIDVSVRVPQVREFAVQTMTALIEDDGVMQSANQDMNNARVLVGAAWIVGEYCVFLVDPVRIMMRMLVPGVTRLPPTVQAVYLHNVLKIYGHWAATTTTDPTTTTQSILEALGPFKTSFDSEVQERACTLFEILHLALSDLTLVPSIRALFSGDLNPVASKAQKRVPVPAGLDLDQWIHEPEPEPVQEEEEEDEDENDRVPDEWFKQDVQERVVDSDSVERRRQSRAERLRHDPFYIPSKPLYDDIDINEIPIVRLELDVPPEQAPTKQAPTTQAPKKKKKRPVSPSPVPKSYSINRGGDMPENSSVAVSSEDEVELEVDEVTKAVMSVDLSLGEETRVESGPGKVDARVDVPAKEKTKSTKTGKTGKKKTKTESKTKTDKRKKKRPVSIADPSLAPSTINKSLLAVRGLEMNTPYERVASPAPTEQEWVDIGGDERFHVALKYKLLSSSTTLTLLFTNKTPSPLPLTATLSDTDETLTITLPPTSNATRTLSLTSTHHATWLDVLGMRFPLPIPMSPESFNDLVANTNWTHTSRKRIPISGATTPEICSSVANVLGMQVVQVVGDAGTLVMRGDMVLVGLAKVLWETGVVCVELRGLGEVEELLERLK
ncbi:hypothetical protein SpCBS45565_g06328 [Spizellomyces sp. 'palustris']|nr:hypothetical protein SpCBS45565_g06328 [Spizellomyces sp. 'palustris']